jgi:hypothetical protein
MIARRRIYDEDEEVETWFIDVGCSSCCYAQYYD